MCEQNQTITGQAYIHYTVALCMVNRIAYRALPDSNTLQLHTLIDLHIRGQEETQLHVPRFVYILPSP